MNDERTMIKFQRTAPPYTFMGRGGDVLWLGILLGLIFSLVDPR